MKRQANACRLLTPGPVSIEASVLEAMTCCPSPADAAFISMMEDVRRRLLRVAGMRPAEYAAVLTAGPCAFALEAALTTLIPEESRVLVVCNGAASIDVLVSGADCGLQGVSGLSFVLARRSILESSEGRAHSVSLDLFEGLRRQEAGIENFLPPQAVSALHAALDALDKEGGFAVREASSLTSQKSCTQAFGTCRMVMSSS